MFQVAAKNQVGRGEFTELPKSVTPKSQFKIPGPPSAPVPEEVGRESCTLSWSPPEEDGGTPITGYYVERCQASSARWLRVNKQAVAETTYEVKDLIEDTTYKFRIVAVNKVGEGPAGPESMPVLAKDPFNKPGKPDAPTIGKTSKKSVALTWSPPKSDGGSPIFNYVVEYRVEGGFKWVKANDDETVSETRYTVTGLISGTVYEFRVAAENKAGVGPASDPTAPVKAAEPVIGAAPALLKELRDLETIAPKDFKLECSITKGDPKIEIHWYKDNKEIYDGKKHLISYSNEVASLTVKHAELSDGGWYRCEASNKLGRVQTQCTVTVYCAPTIDYEAKLKETQTLKAGKSLILTANVSGMPEPKVTWLQNDSEIRPGVGISFEGDNTFSRLTIRNTTAKNAGRYMIRAENKVGSEEAEFKVVVLDKPSAPQNLRVKDVSPDNITLVWDEPEVDGGSKITGYTIEKADVKRRAFGSAGSTRSDTMEFQVTKLYEGNEYLFKVYAENAVGQSEPASLSEPVTAKLPFDPPGPPLNVQVKDLTKSSCTLKWEPPSFDGGSPIKGYYVEKTSGYSTRWIKVNRDLHTKTSMTFDDLIEGTEYDFRVCAENKAGVGKPSASCGQFVAKDPFSTPGKPGTPDVNDLTAESCRLTWSAPDSDGGSHITNYIVEMREVGDSKFRVLDSTCKVCEYQVTRLREGVSYEFRVTAENKAGQGPPSNPSEQAKYTEAIRFTKELEDMTIKEVGITVTLVCELSKEGLKVDWYKDNKKVRRDEKRDFVDDRKTHKLVIDNVDSEDVGMYRAEYMLLSTQGKLSVQVAPSFGKHSLKEKLILKAGGHAVLELPFTASPKPSVTWTYNGGRMPDSRRFNEDVIHNMTSLQMKKLITSDAGDYCCTIKNDLGQCQFTVKVMILDKPGPPTHLKITGFTERSVSLKWSAPDYDGGADITSYIVEEREASRRTWAPSGTVEGSEKRELTTTGLSEGSQYLFRVAAENSVGRGEFVELTKSITAKSQHDVPGAPSRPTVSEIFKTSCVVAWQAPETDGGSPITGYYVERCSTKSRTRWLRVTKRAVKELTYNVDDLVEDNEYQFRIIAENKIGCGPPGPPSEDVLAKDPWGPPSKPGTPEFDKIDSDRMTLTWTKPKSDGGAEITNYVLEYRREGAFKWVKATEETVPTCKFTVKGLRQGDLYEFRVAAQNKAGVGPSSANTMPTKAEEVVAGKKPKLIGAMKDAKVIAPKAVTLSCDISPGEPKAKCRWFKDAKEVYASKKYVMKYDDDRATLTINDTELVDAATYRCEADNKVGRVETDATLTVMAAPAIQVDTKCKDVKVKAGAMIILTANITGLPQPSMEWTHNGKPLPKTSNITVENVPEASTLTIKGSAAKHCGKYTITAQNEVGMESVDCKVTVTDKPEAPQNLRVTEVSRDYMVLTWETPESDGGANITGYSIEKKDASKMYWGNAGSVNGNTLTFKVSKLFEGSEYLFRVAAENKIGLGEFAELSEAVQARLPFEPPGPPRRVEVEDLAKSSCTITWRAPEFDGGSPITGYYVERQTAYASRWIKVNKAPIRNTCYEVKDLVESNEYDFRVIAENDAGVGRPSETTGKIEAKDPYEKPSAPGTPVVEEIIKDTVSLSWAPPKSDGNSSITNYVLESRAHGEFSWTVVNISERILKCKYLVKNLKEDVEYDFRVSAENSVGQGPPSDSVSCKYREAVEFLKPLTDQKTSTIPDTITFQCEISSATMEMTWYKGDRALRKSDKYQISSVGGVHKLVINDADDRDVGEYSCSCRSASTEARLIITAPPKISDITKYQETIVLHTNKSVIVEVPFTASPQPEVEWTYNGGRLPDARRITSETIYNMTALTLSRAYKSDTGDYTLSLKNEHGKASVNVKVRVIDKPDPPRDLAVKDLNSRWVSLKWAKPEEDGGTDITGYIIEKKEGNKRMWQNVGTTSSLNYTVENLIEGNKYSFRVIAENEVGQSEPNEMRTVVTTQSKFSVPDAPSAPSVGEIFKDSCELSWQAPARDGGKPITHYIVERRTGTHWLQCKTKPTTTSMKVTELQEDTRYEFRILAENSVGVSKPSPACSPIVARDPWKKPGAPGRPSGSPSTNTEIEVEWGPADDGGCALEGYIVECKTKGGLAWKSVTSKPVKKLMTIAEHLMEDVEYEFRVAAVNKAGQGPWSESSRYVRCEEPLVGTKPKLITPMDDLTVTAPKSGVLKCKFDVGEPAAKCKWYQNNKEVYESDKYEMSFSKGVATLTFNKTDALDAAKYRCEAYNKIGRSETTGDLTVLAAPIIELDSQYKMKVEVKGGRSIILTGNFTGCPNPKAIWKLNGSPLSQSADITIDTGADHSTIQIRDSNKNYSGTFTLVAENKIGSDSADIKVEVKDKPDAPRNLHTVGQSKDYVKLSWEEPENSGGMPITSYIIERREASRSTWTSCGSVSGDKTKFKVTKLYEGTEYVFRVAAENKIGTGPYREMEDSVVAKLPFGVPNEPRSLEVENMTASSAVLVWEKPDFDGGSPITGYYVEKRQGYSARWMRVNRAPVSSPMINVKDLVEDEEYEFQVFAENEAGVGRPCDSISFRARDPYTTPGKPGKPSVNLEGDAACLTWTKPRDDGRSKIINYEVEYKIRGDFTWKKANRGEKVTATSFTVTQLESDNDYEFRVTAENKAGLGQPSDNSDIIRYEEKILFTRELQDIKIIRLPSQAVFECEISRRDVPVQWYRNDEPMKRGDRYEIEVEGCVHRLIIHEADGQDEARYSIFAKNNRSAADLTICAPPVFLTDKYKDTLHLKEGDTIIMELPFNANPQPRASWEHDGKAVMTSRRITQDTIHNMTSMCIGHCTLADAGRYRVHLENQHGAVTLNIDVVVKGRPSAPQDLKVTSVTENSVSLAWKPPRNDGGMEVRGYKVEKRDPHRMTYSLVGTTMTTDFKVSRLVEGNQYVFQVSAENAVGVGEPAELSQGITAKSPYVPPSAPDAPKVSNLARDSLTLTWHAPMEDGGTPVTGYHIERRSTTAKRWVFINRAPITETSLKVRDLYVDNEYEFRVSAENKVGTGSPSVPCEPALCKDPWDKPGPPTNVQVVEVHKRSVVLTWRAPTNDGGSPVTGYRIEFRIDGGFKWERANEGEHVDGKKYTVTGLKEGTVYEFRVAAENKAGVGAYAECSMPVQVKEPVVGDAPKLISGLSDESVIAPEVATLECQVKLGSDTAEIHWYKNAKELYQGRKYDMLYWDNKASLVIKDTETTDAGNYRCEVYSKLGSVETTGALTVFKLPVLEYDSMYKKPINVKAGNALNIDCSFSGVPAPKVEWLANGMPIAQSSRVDLSTDEYHSTLRITGMSSTDAGSYKIKISNKAGSDTASFDVTVKGKPSKPRNLEVDDATPSSVSLKWDRSEEDGGSRITGYRIEKRDAERTGWINVATVGAESTRYTVPNLWEGNEYFFRVSAENDVGSSEPFELTQPVRCKLPFSPPSAPRNVRLSDVTRKTANLTWTTPSDDGGAPIQGYIVEKRTPYSPRWSKVNRLPTRETELALEDLRQGEDVEFRVFAVNEAGYGTPSDSTEPTTVKDPFDKPSQPSEPIIESIRANAATIAWTAPRSDGGTPITNYKIEMRSIGSYRWDVVNPFEKVTDTRYTVRNLMEETDYEFRVSAENKAGVGQPGPASKSAKYVEEVSFVRPLKDIKITTISETAIFECEVTKTNARATWMKDGHNIIEDRKYNISVDGGVHRLAISKVDSTDMGDYAVNIKGHRSAARLEVEAKPEFHYDDKYRHPITLKAGSTLTIEVPFSASPQPKVTWRFNGEPVRESRKCTMDVISNMTSVCVGRVTRADAGNYVLRLENRFGSVTLDVEVIVLDKPSEPQNLRVQEVGDDWVALAWNPPRDNGGSPVTSYTVEKREALRMIWQNCGTTSDTNFQVGRLHEGVQYVFRVSAENAQGSGLPEELTKAVAAKPPYDVPSAPAQPKVSDLTADSCVLSWSAPVSDGGSPIKGYHVERRPTTSPHWNKITTRPISDTTLPVRDLMPGTGYEFRVLAENRAGLGAASVPTSGTIAKDPWQKPSAPLSINISEVTKRSCKVSWRAPLSDGGDSIRNYSVEYKVVGTFKWLKANEGDRTIDNSYRVTGLHTDMDYEFRVAAENRAGIGAYSESTLPVRAKSPETGDAPKVLSPLSDKHATAGHQVKLECEVSLGKPRSEIHWYKEARELYKGSSKFKMAYDDDTGVASLTLPNAEHVDSGRYRIEVRNKHGRVTTEGKLSVDVPPKIEYDARYSGPQEVKAGSTMILPINFTGTPKPKVTWMRNGVPITTMRGHIHVDTGDNYSTLTIMGIEKAEEGRYECIVENHAGTTGHLMNVSVRSTPSAPSNIRVTSILSDSVTLGWGAPDFDGGMPLSGYVIERSNAAHGGWTTVGTTDALSRTFKVPKLLEGNQYYFRVMAENQVGTGAPVETSSSVEVKSPYNVPDAPRNVEAAEVSAHSIVIEWNAPRDDGGAPIRGYVVERRQAFSTRFLRVNRSLLTDTFYQDTNVYPGSDYDYRIAAENEAGIGAFSAPTGAIFAKEPFDVPGAPGIPEESGVTRNSVNLTWRAPRTDGGSPITGYFIEYKSQHAYSWSCANTGFKCVDNSYTVTGLQEGVSFEFRVIAVNKAGKGEPSASSRPIVPREAVSGNAPVVIDPLVDVFARAGERATFECKITGEPVPNITWTKDYERLHDGRKYNIKYRDAIASLVVTDLNEDDVGRITCEAANSSGSVSTSAMLGLQAAPNIKYDSRYEDMMTHVGGMVRMSASYSGEPRPKIQWFKDGAPLYDRKFLSIETTDNMSTLALRRVNRDDAGEYTMVAKNKFGSRDVTFVLKVQDVPSEPLNLTASDIQTSMITLNWLRPKTDGGSKITHYRIERKDKLHNIWVPAGSVDATKTSYTVVNILPGTDYYFRVFAENDTGLSDPCSMSIPVRCKDKAMEPIISHELVPFAGSTPPTLPPVTAIRATERRRESLTLAWEPPIMRGSLPRREPHYKIKSYIIERDDHVTGDWQRVAALPPTTTRYTVPDLVEDRAYRFRIFPEADIGIGRPIEYQAPVYAAKPVEHPYRPVGPIIVTKVSSHSIMIEWRPPLDDGGDPIRGYSIEMSEGGGSWKRVGYTSCRDCSFTIAALTEGSTYFFRVAAENSVGFSRPLQSDCVVPSKPIMAPSPPSAMKFRDVRRDSVAIEWEPPEYDGGAPLTGYLVEKKDPYRERWSYVSRVPASTYRLDIPGLITGREYMFRVRPENRIGLGEAIVHEGLVTPVSQYKPPSAPTGPVRVLWTTDNSCELRWQPPEVYGGTPITSYILEMRESTTTYWRRIGNVEATTTNFHLHNLMEGKEYHVRIIAKNQEGESLPLMSDLIAPQRRIELPSAPNTLKIIRITRDSVTLEWFAPYDGRGAALTKYKIYKNDMMTSVWEEVGTSPARTTKFTVSGLRENRQYIFAVSACNKQGEGDRIETTKPIMFKRTVSKPQAPKELVVTAISQDSVALTWHYHDIDRSMVTNYRIERRQVNSNRWEIVATVDASTNNYTVRGLKPGTDYFFRVVAENTAGSSDPLSLEKSVVPKSAYAVPEPPRGPLEVSEISSTSVTINWQAPLSDGNAALISYIIERREVNMSTWYRVARIKPYLTSYTVSNIFENHEYVFRVFAENIEGLSEPLTLDLPVVPRRPASRPEPPSGRLKVRKVTGDSVVIEWNRPSDTGGSRILNYIVEYREVEHVRWFRSAIIDGETYNCTIRGLKDFKEYLFRVISVNSYGESFPLEVDMAIRPIREAEPPASPGGPLIISEVLRHSMTLAWQPPHTDGGATISGYIIEKKDTSSFSGWLRVDRVKAHIFSYTVTNLVPSHKYYFRIIAENSVGRSPPLETRSPTEARSPFAVPEAPGAVRLIGISEETVTIEWSPPSVDGGSHITNYIIERRDNINEKWTCVATVNGRTLSYVLRYLLPNTTYYIRVAAENEEGIGEWRELSESVRPMKPKSLPSMPLNLCIDCLTRDSVTLKWDRPTDTGGVPLSGYIIEQQSGHGSWRTTAYVEPTRTWWTIHNLIQGYEYDFRIKAENPDGAGPAKTLTHPVVPKPVIWRPAAPARLEVTALSEDSVTLSWLSPERDGGSRIFRYVVELHDVSRAEGWIKVKEVSSSEHLMATIDNLREGKPYVFRVYAENEVGPGPAYELTESVIPRALIGSPSAPQGPLRVIRVTRNMLAIHWRPPRDNGGALLTRYIVQKREADRSAWSAAGICAADVTTHCITDLLENQMYYIRVIAENAYGRSEPLEIEKPIVPRRIYESASTSEVETWVQEAQVDSSEVSRVLEQTRISITQTSSSRSYSAYSDEPLTRTADMVDTFRLMPRF